MESVKIIVSIKAIHELNIECNISSDTENTCLSYFPGKGTIVFNEESHLTEIIRINQYQFKKVMHSAINGNLRIGQTINCVFIKDFNFLCEADYNRFIRVNRSKSKLEITTSETGTKGIHKIYADGSFVNETRRSGYGGFIENPEGKQEVFYQSFYDGGSNLMELLAVTEGLQRLKSIEKIQVNTDSRFVIRGLVQWIHFWKLNNWQTAYGCEVKFAKCWQQIDKLCEGKILEFKWIKGHSGHKEQDFCHQLARQSVMRS